MSSQMVQDRLDILGPLSEMRKREQAATEGPWIYTDDRVSDDGQTYTPLTVHAETVSNGDVAEGHDQIIIQGSLISGPTVEDSLFVARSREDFDRLLTFAEAATALHHPLNDGGPEYCAECSTEDHQVTFPCPTITALTNSLAGNSIWTNCQEDSPLRTAAEAAGRSLATGLGSECYKRMDIELWAAAEQGRPAQYSAQDLADASMYFTLARDAILASMTATI